MYVLVSVLFHSTIFIFSKIWILITICYIFIWWCLIHFFYITASNELVIINFYAEWCRFSNILTPIFEEAAAKVSELYPDFGKVVMGKVDCDKESKFFLKFIIKTQNVWLV